MKVHELINSRLLESTITGDVTFLKQLKAEEHQSGEVNVTGSVRLNNKRLVKLPVKFGKIGGGFSCIASQLTSLEGAPHTVGENFSCEINKLTSLKDAPQMVGGSFSCNGNKLTSLEGAPHTIGGGVRCGHNQLTSLEGIHKLIKKINGDIYIEGNSITSGGIGLILIDGLTKIISSHPAFKIINKYLGQGKKGLLLCQDELINADYEEYAKL